MSANKGFHILELTAIFCLISTTIARPTQTTTSGAQRLSQILSKQSANIRPGMISTYESNLEQNQKKILSDVPKDILGQEFVASSIPLPNFEIHNKKLAEISPTGLESPSNDLILHTSTSTYSTSSSKRHGRRSPSMIKCIKCTINIYNK